MREKREQARGAKVDIDGLSSREKLAWAMQFIELPRDSKLNQLLLGRDLMAVKEVLIALARNRDQWPTEWSGLGPITCRVNEQGRIKVTTQLSEILDGADISLIRECKRCGKVFYAPRKKSETCSPQCWNTLRMRQRRKR